MIPACSPATNAPRRVKHAPTLETQTLYTQLICIQLDFLCQTGTTTVLSLTHSLTVRHCQPSLHPFMAFTIRRHPSHWYYAWSSFCTGLSFDCSLPLVVLRDYKCIQFSITASESLCQFTQSLNQAKERLVPLCSEQKSTACRLEYGGTLLGEQRVSVIDSFTNAFWSWSTEECNDYWLSCARARTHSFDHTSSYALSEKAGHSRDGLKMLSTVSSVVTCCGSLVCC